MIKVKFHSVSLIAVLATAAFLPAAAEGRSYGGRAFSAYVDAPTLGTSAIYLSDTGSLWPEGGWEGAGSLRGDIPGVISSSVLNATTSGGDGTANSAASLADVVVFGGQPAELKASFVLAEAQAGSAGGLGAVEIYDLTFGGIPVTVTGEPNQSVTIPGVATLIIDERSISADGNSVSISALRLSLVTGDQVVLAGASSQVDPTSDGQMASAALRTFSGRGSQWTIARDLDALRRGSIQPAHVGEEGCIDFVTGGGFFLPPNSTRPGRVNFGFNAGPRSAQNPELKGHLNHVDHHDGTHISGVSVDNYFAFGGDPDHCRIFEGDATVNGVPGHRYTAGVCDYGEPGRDDRYQLTVTLAGVEVYFVDNHDGTPFPYGGELDGGNIQLHKTKCVKEAAGPSSTSGMSLCI